MGRVGPVYREAVRVDRVLRGRVDQCLHVDRMRIGFHRGHEPRSDAGPRRSGGEHGREATAVGDPARGEYGDVDRVEYATKEGKDADPPADVAAGFNPLGNNEVAPGAFGRGAFLDGADLPAGEGAVTVDSADKCLVRLAPEEVDDTNVLRRDGYAFRDVVFNEGHREVAAGRPTRAATEIPQDVSQKVRRESGDRDQPQPAGFGDGRREADIGQRADRRLLNGNRTPDQVGERGADHHTPPLLASAEAFAQLRDYAPRPDDTFPPEARARGGDEAS